MTVLKYIWDNESHPGYVVYEHHNGLTCSDLEMARAHRVANFVCESDALGYISKSKTLPALQEIGKLGDLPNFKEIFERLGDVRYHDKLYIQRARAQGEVAELPSVCDGKEQDAFEKWAAAEKLNMETHPLHWLFLDPKTYAARQGWKGALEYVNAIAAAAKETKE